MKYYNYDAAELLEWMIKIARPSNTPGNKTFSIPAFVLLDIIEINSQKYNCYRPSNKSGPSPYRNSLTENGYQIDQHRQQDKRIQLE